ncbi:SAM-dependent methyltransferase [Amycolatopsis sp. 195334CR]|uniref:SAM-dependent methyltransferase n=1 Tax=Amycolatopsis sp. 195334CR TaxID=2814588 RepID=UPI001A8C3E02|nr:SAM-dependent methyltransferase [Amycolatopsis sp. 195334CR]MBN6035863.1 SAM-dependent methyltransferase [Amycolatopsis sp. 195334CR]
MPGPGPVPIDYSQPNQARFHDALLGGADNYEADRELLRRVLEVVPGAPAAAKELQLWMLRAVRFLAERAGVAQFADLGSGLPSAPPIHRVVQQFHPRARVAYVDNDPLVLAHGRARLVDYDSTHFLGCDFTDPAGTLADLAVHLDLDQPVGLVANAMLHHLEDLDQAKKVLHGYVDALAPGSYLLLTHLHNESPAARELLKLYEGTPLQAVARSREQITELFDGLRILEPGLVHAHQWWPDGPRMRPLSDAHETHLCGVARKD